MGGAFKDLIDELTQSRLGRERLTTDNGWRQTNQTSLAAVKNQAQLQARATVLQSLGKKLLKMFIRRTTSIYTKWAGHKLGLRLGHRADTITRSSRPRTRHTIRCMITCSVRVTARHGPTFNKPSRSTRKSFRCSVGFRRADSRHSARFIVTYARASRPHGEWRNWMLFGCKISVPRSRRPSPIPPLVPFALSAVRWRILEEEPNARGSLSRTIKRWRRR
jgi:hypothetical protein